MVGVGSGAGAKVAEGWAGGATEVVATVVEEMAAEAMVVVAMAEVGGALALQAVVGQQAGEKEVGMEVVATAGKVGA